ncbi:hypothetical protein P7K49_030973 [Saguinus oedipus]|uniref:Uncharacterized protein n=1 Tax=Saguinus oedipus TaxID=9490 RepID=A0ABQ9U4L0_SAGOE|nr:hypothetical protein P7K49_030973 [Saguinus oedipus]
MSALANVSLSLVPIPGLSRTHFCSRRPPRPRPSKRKDYNPQKAPRLRAIRLVEPPTAANRTPGERCWPGCSGAGSQLAMGSTESSESRRVSFGVDEEERVRVLQGVQVSSAARGGHAGGGGLPPLARTKLRGYASPRLTALELLDTSFRDGVNSGTRRPGHVPSPVRASGSGYAEGCRRKGERKEGRKGGRGEGRREGGGREEGREGGREGGREKRRKEIRQ